jgi:hypothetical protein
MYIHRRILTLFVMIGTSLMLTASAAADGTLLRWHRMGEQEGGVNNGAVFQTLDTNLGGADFTDLPLDGTNTPTYRTIAGRPDGGGGIGIEFNAAQSENLSGVAINRPSQSQLEQGEGGSYDLAGISDRGFQFWARPTSTTAAQSLVLDTDRHGARINSSGRFSMLYNNAQYDSDPDSTMPVVANTWYHIEVVRPDGPASRSRMYVNGVAVAVSDPVDYANDNLTFMSVGSNTAGTDEFFSGIIDELKFNVYGTSDPGGVVYGEYNFSSDNDYADFKLTGVPGDLDHSGMLTQADKDAFIDGWMDKKVINGFQIGDLDTFESGDLNLDGITNIFDLAIMQGALSGAGMGAITSAELAGIPEPASIVLLLSGMAASLAWRRRRA